MSMADCIVYCRQALQNYPPLKACLRKDDVQIGPSRHGDSLRIYEVRIMPGFDEEPQEGRTFQAQGRQYVGATTREAATKIAHWKVYLEIWVREPDIEVMILGRGPENPGLCNFVSLIKDALERNWRFKRSIQALEFDVVTYVMNFPPPHAQLTVAFREEISVETRTADTSAFTIPEGGQP